MNTYMVVVVAVLLAKIIMIATKTKFSIIEVFHIVLNTHTLFYFSQVAFFCSYAFYFSFL